MSEVVVGVDIGGSSTTFGLVNWDGKVIATSYMPTPTSGSFEDFCEGMVKKIQDLRLRAGENVVMKGIGIGAPNGNILNGSISFAPNLIWDAELPLAREFSKSYDVPIMVTNDANAAALGEMLYGVAQDMEDFILITLGTGLGSGFVVGGEMMYGHDGMAGELGHTVLIPGGRKCSCGKEGCIETYVSTRGIVQTAFELLDEMGVESQLKGMEPKITTPAEITSFARRGDEVCIKTYEKTAEYLGMKLADAVAVTSPEAIILFGGITQAEELIMVPLKKYLEENLLKIYKGKVALTLSGLPENHAAILGAAALVWDRIAQAELN